MKDKAYCSFCSKHGHNIRECTRIIWYKLYTKAVKKYGGKKC